MSNTKNTIINIASRHASLSEAVEAAKLDLSYNPEEAKRKIKYTETGRDKSGEAFVSTQGDVYFLYHCDITILNKFEPFSSTLHDGSFSPVIIHDDSIIILGDVKLPNTARVSIARLGLTVAKL